MPEPGLSVLSEPEEIALGEEGSYTLELVNTGDEKYEDSLEVLFSTGDESFTGSELVSLDPGETFNLDVNVGALEDSGQFGEEYLPEEWNFDVPTGKDMVDVEFDMADGPSKSSNYAVVDSALFNDPLIDEFDKPPSNTGELDPTLYEDLNGDGDGTGVSQTVRLFGQEIRGNGPNLTAEQAQALNWNSDSPSDELTVSDLVSLFGEQIRHG